MPPDIALFISPNEFIQHEKDKDKPSRGTIYTNHAMKHKEDIAHIENQTNIAADLRFEHPETGGVLNVEVKLAKDAITSVLGGHLGQQVMQFTAANEPAVIVVWGAPEQIFNATNRSPVNGGGFSVAEQLRDYNRYLAFKYDAWARCGIPTLEIPVIQGKRGSIQHPAEEIMRLGITFIRGGNIIRHLSKKDGMEVGAGVISRVPSVGVETAEFLIKAFGNVGRVVNAARVPRELAEVKINGRKLGKKAEALHQAFWGVTA